MAEAQKPPAGPDLTQGVTLDAFTGETLLGHVGDDEILLVRATARFSRSTPIAATIMDRWRMASSPTVAFAVRGTMPVSICAPARPCAHGAESAVGLAGRAAQ